MSDSSLSPGLQQARFPCPSPTLGTHSNSRPLSWWCHPTISPSVIPFSSCLQSFPASGSFPMSQFFASGGHKYWSFNLSISPSKKYSALISFRIDLLNLLAVQWTVKEFSTAPQFKCINSSALSFLHSPTLTSIHDYWKNHALIRQTFVGKVMSLIFNMLSRLVITFLPRRKCILISWLQSPSAVIFGGQENKVSHCSYFNKRLLIRLFEEFPTSM